METDIKQHFPVFTPWYYALIFDSIAGDQSWCCVSLEWCKIMIMRTTLILIFSACFSVEGNVIWSAGQFSSEVFDSDQQQLIIS